MELSRKQARKSNRTRLQLVRQKRRRLEKAAPDLLEALEFVQTALADWRDGKDYTTHPRHGKLGLEET